MKTIKFSVSDVEYAAIAFEARAKGLTASAFVKTAVFAYVSKYPAKGLMAEIARSHSVDSHEGTEV